MAASWKKDIGRLLATASEQGFRVEKRKSGHIMVKPPDKTKAVISLSSTPSDSRSVKNARALLRRSGLVF
jgi:hypothetical protein